MRSSTVLQPAVAAKVKQALASIPPIPWQVVPTTHEHILKTQIRTVLSKVVPAKKNAAPKPSLKDDSTSVGRDRADFGATSKQHKQEIDRDFIYNTFRVWKYRRVSECVFNLRERFLWEKFKDLVWCSIMVSILSPILTTLVKKDKQYFLETTLDEIEESMGEGDLRKAFKTMELVQQFQPSLHS